jgi:predicted Zn-dependent peptidase
VGLFSIKTDVLNDRWEQTLDCIQQEIEKLKEEEIGSGELAVVKNYLSGSLARLFDGALVQSERLETILSERLDWDYYEKYLLAVKETSSSFLKELAIKYLNYERFTTLVVGSK